MGVAACTTSPGPLRSASGRGVAEPLPWRSRSCACHGRVGSSDEFDIGLSVCRPMFLGRRPCVVRPSSDAAGVAIACARERAGQATSESCAFVTFRTELSLSDVLQLDADVFITDGTPLHPGRPRALAVASSPGCGTGRATARRSHSCGGRGGGRCSDGCHGDYPWACGPTTSETLACGGCVRTAHLCSTS